MSWYYVDAAGQTQGAFDVSEMKQKYAARACTDESYIWNGTSVKQWTPLKQVPELLNQVKISQAAPSRPAQPAPSQPARSQPSSSRSAYGGGAGRPKRAGRPVDFLAQIQSKKKSTLKKTITNDRSAPVAGSSGGGTSKKPQGDDFMSQLKGAMKGRASGGKIGGGGGGWKKSTTSSSSAKNTTSPSSSPAKKWGNSGGSGGSLQSRKTNVKKKIDNITSSEEWKLKAIEKILS